MKMKQILALTALLSSATVVRAAYVWVGASGGGDGIHFSDVKNWQDQNAPKGRIYDAILFNDGGTFTNDLTGLEIRVIQFNSKNPVTLAGNEIAFYDGPYTGYNSLSNGANLTVYCPIKLAYNKQITLFPAVQWTKGTGVRFYGDFTFADHALLNIVGPKQQSRTDEVWFYGAINGGYNSRIRVGFGRASKAYFKNEVHLGVIESYGVRAVYNGSPISFDHTGNTYTNLYADYKTIYTGCANALYAVKPIEFGHTYAYANCNIYDFSGYDQEAAGISTPTTLAIAGNYSDVIQSTNSMTLSLTGSSDYFALAVVKGAVSLKWAPNGNYTQTFKDATHTTTGTITVASGVFQTSGTCTFASVTNLVVKDGAVFKVAAGASDPFGASTKVVARLEKGAKIELEDGATITLDTVWYDGLPVKGRSFTTANADWLQGTGTATALTDADAGATYWSAKASGDWETAANWSNGLPSDSLPAFVTYEGTSPYTVAINDTVTMMPETTVGGNATVEVKGTVTIQNHNFDLLDGGTLKASGDAVVFLCNYPSPASDRFRQSGGSIDFSGNAAFYVLDSHWYPTFGRGQTTFSGDSRIETGNGSASMVYIRPDKAGEENAAVVTLSDRAWLANPGDAKSNTIVVDGYVDGGYGKLIFDSIPKANHFCGQVKLGNGRGTAYLDLRRGCLDLCGRNKGVDCLYVGGFSHTYAAEQAIYYGNATMHVATGACVRVGGSTSTGGKTGYDGVWVGDNVTTRTGAMLGSGKLWLDGGALTNRYGPTVLGAGQAKGTLLMTGGEYIAGETALDDYYAIIGLAGGQGEWIVSNGTVRLLKDVYVGGMQTNHTSYVFQNVYYSTRHNATGALTLAKAAEGDCSFSTAGEIVVADDGTGTVTVGAGGELQAAAMTLNNANAALDFEVGAKGAGKLTLGGALTVGAGAKVRIRDTGMADRAVTLAAAAAITGLAADDIEIDGPDAAAVQLIGGKLKYWPDGISGMAVIVR